MSLWFVFMVANLPKMTKQARAIAHHIYIDNVKAVQSADMPLCVVRYYAGWADKNQGKTIPIGMYGCVLIVDRI